MTGHMMGVEWLIIGGGVAAIVAVLAARRIPSQQRKAGVSDDAGSGYLYSADAFSGDTSSSPDCGDAGGGSDAGAGCDGGGGDGGGGGGD